MVIERPKGDPGPLIFHTEGAEMIKAKPTSERYDTLSEALKILDPQGKIEPGTVEHNTVSETILSWMAEMEPHEVLKKSETAKLSTPFQRPELGTRPYRTIKDMIQDWINQHGPEKALKIARKGENHLPDA